MRLLFTLSFDSLCKLKIPIGCFITLGYGWVDGENEVRD